MFGVLGKIQFSNRISESSSFEIVRNTEQFCSDLKQPLLFGHIDVDDNSMAFSTLKALCSKDGVDKIVIVYNDYAFALVGVSLTENNDDSACIRLRGKYSFCLKDIRLKGVPGSESMIARATFNNS